ncbi:MAG: hypothetical protein ABL994_07085 [Verrucomicrobiales bacterium]
MQTRSIDFLSAPATDDRDESDQGELEDVLGGRYSVEVNIDGIADGVPGEWTDFCNHDTLGNAVRASSAFMALTKHFLGVDSLDDRADGRIEPWIRVTDHWDEEVVLWAFGGALFVREEE